LSHQSSAGNGESSFFYGHAGAAAITVESVPTEKEGAQYDDIRVRTRCCVTNSRVQSLITKINGQMLTRLTFTGTPNFYIDALYSRHSTELLTFPAWRRRVVLVFMHAQRKSINHSSFKGAIPEASPVICTVGLHPVLFHRQANTNKEVIPTYSTGKPIATKR
jgi:hypothetical protein